MSIKVIEGDFAASKGKYALIVSRWNSFVVESLKEGALDTLRRHGIKDENVTIYYAPGAFEFPVVAQKIAAKKEFDAIIALGAVIRGGTPHFDYVAGECTKGLAQAPAPKSCATWAWARCVSCHYPCASPHCPVLISKSWNTSARKTANNPNRKP